MSIFWCRVKYFIQSVLAVVLALAMVCFIRITNVSRFSSLRNFVEGTREIVLENSVFYLQSASSQGLRKERLTLRDFSSIRGESLEISVVGNFDINNANDGGVYAMKVDNVAYSIAEKLGAEIIFTEESAGIKSYYAHTLQWTDGVILYGKKINLHIAFRLEVVEDESGEEQISGVIGSPIIFDGY